MGGATPPQEFQINMNFTILLFLLIISVWRDGEIKILFLSYVITYFAPKKFVNWCHCASYALFRFWNSLKSISAGVQWVPDPQYYPYSYLLEGIEESATAYSWATDIHLHALILYEYIWRMQACKLEESK